MYIVSAKAYYFCIFVCFAFMYALLAHMYDFIWYQTCTSPEHSKAEFLTFEKWHSVSYRYVSYLKSEISFIWRTGSWFLKPFEERVEENNIYHIVKPNSIVKTWTVYRECNACYQFFWKVEKLTLIAKFESLT